MAESSSLKVPSKAGLKNKSQSGLVSRSRKSLTRSRNSLGAGEALEVEDWEPTKDPVAPADQLQLTDAQLKEEMTLMLRADNKQAPDNMVYFSFKDLEFVSSGTVDQTAYHFSLDGHMLHVESDEGKWQQSRRGRSAGKQSRPSVILAAPGQPMITEGVADTDVAAMPAEHHEMAVGDDPVAAAEGAPSATAPDEGIHEGGAGDDDAAPASLRNQFNFSERGSQTTAHPVKERGINTEPAPRANLGGNVTQWTIYDRFVADAERKAALTRKDPKAAKESVAATSENKYFDVGLTATGRDGESAWSGVASMLTGAIVGLLERMVIQNVFDEVSQDYKFWDDPTDAIKEREGSLLPLWKFGIEAAKKKHVTALTWHPTYGDLFAAGYGSFDFTKQTSGLICLYTLKNPAHPLVTIATESGVTSVDFNATHERLLLVGHYDGSVAVYSVSSTEATRVAISTVDSGKHGDTVWQVRWLPDDLDGNCTFCSVAADGRVSAWTLVRDQLSHADLILLAKEPAKGAVPGASAVFNLASGSCVSFNPHLPHLFLVGTEEGIVHKCSTAYTSKFLHSYPAHGMTVYAAEWNPFHSRVFATCGADWRLKIWDHDMPEPVFVYDLGNAVGDVAWSPFSSTVLAAVTTDGRVHVFDLAVDKYAPLCAQHVARKGKLTHVAFKRGDPIIIVGDDRGAVTSFKLSPNLRKALKGKLPTDEQQVEALEKVLESVKEGPARAQPAQ